MRQIQQSEALRLIKKLIITILAIATYFLLGTHITNSAIEPETQKEPSVEELIKHYAGVYGVNEQLALNIAKCESGLNPEAKNPYSSAKGVYQFIDGTWAWYSTKFEFTGNVLSAKDNVELAMKVMGKHGTNDWLASYGCWNI